METSSPSRIVRFHRVLGRLSSKESISNSEQQQQPETTKLKRKSMSDSYRTTRTATPDDSNTTLDYMEPPAPAEVVTPVAPPPTNSLAAAAAATASQRQLVLRSSASSESQRRLRLSGSTGSAKSSRSNVEKQKRRLTLSMSVRMGTADSTGQSSDNDDENNDNSNSNGNHHPNADRKKTLRKCFPWVTNFREQCGKFVNDGRVQIGIIVLIVINALMMGLGTFDFVTGNSSALQAFETTDVVFLSIFTVELGMQFLYRGWRLFTDGWLVFDFVIVLSSWSFSSMQVIRTFRIFRAVRLISRLEVLRNLVLALFEVAPSLFAILSFLLLVMYIYAVMCTVLFKDLYEMGVTKDVDRFGRLDKTLFTLLEMMTLEWAEVVREVEKEYPWARPLFVSFVIFSSFILYSLIIAVVCDAVAVTEHHEELEIMQQEKEEMRQQVDQLEKRLHDMTLQQQVVLESLQTALTQLSSSETPPVLENSDTSLNLWELPAGQSDQNSRELDRAHQNRATTDSSIQQVLEDIRRQRLDKETSET